jgi:acyl-coenzyme A synthetase/AMP-(fatty) acid ligase
VNFYDFTFISKIAQSNAKDFAYIDEKRKVTFAQFDTGTRKIGLYLKNIGLKQDQMVALILPTYFSWFFTFTLHRMGISVLPKNTYSNFALEVIPDYLISFQYHPNFPKEKTILINPDVMRDIENTPEDRSLNGYAGPDSQAIIFSTSGTTGGARYISYTAQILEKRSIRKQTLDFLGLDFALTLYPFSSTQNYWLALKSLLAGRTFYGSEFRDFYLPRFISENPIRTLAASPTQVSGLLEVQAQTGTNFPLLKTIILSGSPPSMQLVERIKSQIDCRIFNSFGSTEGGGVGYVEITEGVEESNGFELIHEDLDLQIVDENDNPLPAMSIGHIRYRRTDMATSYYKNPVATAQVFKDGYFYPGDLGFLDDKGRLHLEGRSKDIINLGGVKINPERIESIALAQLGVSDCAAFAQVGESGVEELCIAVVVESDFSQEIFEKVMEKKSPHTIGQIKIVSVIPRNEMGKIQRNFLFS